MGAKAALKLLQRTVWALRQLLGAAAAALPRGHRLDSLQGHVALVVGAGSGLGRELSVQLALCGCQLICVDTDIDAATATADIINTKVRQGCAAAHACDTGDRLEVLQLTQEVLRGNGRVHVLALAAPPHPAKDACQHLTAQFWVALGFVPSMVSQGGGRVLAVCNEATPGDAASVYSVATSGLMEALSEQLRGTGVKLTCAHRYHLPNQGLALPIPELSVEHAAAELVAALRRGQRLVLLPPRPLFWHSVLRTLHLAADETLRDAFRLEPTRAVAATAPSLETREVVAANGSAL